LACAEAKVVIPITAIARKSNFFIPLVFSNVIILKHHFR
jgi:hypothetical protein